MEAKDVEWSLKLSKVVQAWGTFFPGQQVDVG